MDLPTYKSFTLAQDGGWLTVAFNEPERRNPLTAERAADLVDLLNRVAPARRIRGITLKGEGGIFCAGGDLKAFKERRAGEAGRDALVTDSQGGAALFERVYTQPQVVMASIEGAAMAGGLGLACCADIVLVTKDARFALSEVALGLIPAQIAPYLVERLGASTTRRLMLTAARFEGKVAGALGLADAVADDAAGLLEHEQAIRKAVLRCGPGAVAATKALLIDMPSYSRAAYSTAAAEAFADCVMSEEGAEGLAAFAEKRLPKWAVDA